MKKRGKLKSKPKKVSYKDAKSARDTVKKLNNMPRSEARILANTLSNRAKFHQNKTKEMSEAQKVIDSWRKKERNKDDNMKKSEEEIQELRKDLRRWVDEKWTAQNGQPCGAYTGKGKVKCRPSKKVSSKTPKTWGEMDKKEKKKAVSIKQKAHKEGKQFSNHKTGNTYDMGKNKYTKSLATQERHKKKAKNKMKKSDLNKTLDNVLEKLNKGIDNSGLGGNKGVVLPSINNTTKIKNNNSLASEVGMKTGITQQSKKDPMKQANAIQDKHIKDMAIKEVKQKLASEEVIKYEKNGQWSLEKINEPRFKDGTPSKKDQHNKWTNAKSRKFKSGESQHKKYLDLPNHDEKSATQNKRVMEASDSGIIYDKKQYKKNRRKAKLTLIKEEQVSMQTENIKNAAPVNVIPERESQMVKGEVVNLDEKRKEKKEKKYKKTMKEINDSAKDFQSQLDHAMKHGIPEEEKQVQMPSRKNYPKSIDGGKKEKTSEQEKQVQMPSRKNYKPDLKIVKKTQELDDEIERLEKKLCARGKAAAKRKFDVYPSAYANMYASAVCSGKVKPGGKKDAKKSDIEVAPEGSKNRQTYKEEFEKASEVIKYDSNGQWSLEKSNYKGYTEEDNARRKKKNIGDTGIKAMPRIKQYGKQGANQLDRQVKEAKQKTKKNPVKVFSKEEIEAEMKKRGLKKSAREEIIEHLEKAQVARGKAQMWAKEARKVADEVDADDYYSPKEKRKFELQAFDAETDAQAEKQKAKRTQKAANERIKQRKAANAKKLKPSKNLEHGIERLKEKYNSVKKSAREEMIEHLEKSYEDKAEKHPAHVYSDGSYRESAVHGPSLTRKFKSGEKQHVQPDAPYTDDIDPDKRWQGKRMWEKTSSDKSTEEKKKELKDAAKKRKEKKPLTYKLGSKMKKSAREEMIEHLEKKSSKPFHGYNKNKHSKQGGLSESYRKKYNRETGSNLQKPVTSKEAKSSKKKAGRRKSFCARMSGVKGPTSKDGKLTRKGAALKRWDC